MTNKYMYFIANWKMFGVLNTLNSLHKVIKFFKTFRKNKLIRINLFIGVISQSLKLDSFLGMTAILFFR